MKKILFVLAGALLATAAVAQSASPPGGQGRESYERRDFDERRGFHDRDGRGPSWHDEMMRHHGMGRGGGGGGGWRGMQEGMRDGGMPGRSGGGAHFRLQRGDARIDIRCGDNEPIGVCVEAASRLIDKVMSLGARPGGASPEAPRPQ